MKRKLIALSLTLAMICSIGASTISVQGADSPAEGDAATSAEEIFSANREQSVTVESDGMDETTDDIPQVTEHAPPSTGDETMKGEDGGPNVGEETGDPDEGADEVDKSELDWLINQFVESDFTEESWQEFKPVYDAAVALLANPDATAEQVQQMIQDVQDKSEVLVYTEEAATDQIYKALKQLIDFYEPIFIQSDYTEDTWANYAKALDAAKEVYNKPGESTTLCGRQATSSTRQPISWWSKTPSPRRNTALTPSSMLKSCLNPTRLTTSKNMSRMRSGRTSGCSICSAKPPAKRAFKRTRCGLTPSSLSTIPNL